MQRYHLIRRGRIVASDTHHAYLEAIASAHEKVVSDGEWRGAHFRGALRWYGPRHGGELLRELLANAERGRNALKLNLRSDR